ncbi:hypothetical protein EON82_04995 [bacterium]|nr:MAG: hypothetical protein EON82_04995 [bacterium]
MLETPLYGRFSNEDRMLVFSAPTAYHALIRFCVVGGSLSALYGLLAIGGILEVAAFYPQWWFYTGLAVALAGVLAAYSLVMIRFDIKQGAYRRREGAQAFGATTAGLLSDLDALVLIAEPNSRMTPHGVTYHLVLHWKGNKEPPMVIQQDTRSLPPGQPLNIWAQPLRDRGIKYAQALKVPFYDNAHFASACPVRLISR